jgi:hypothetical protein
VLLVVVSIRQLMTLRTAPDPDLQQAHLDRPAP